MAPEYLNIRGIVDIDSVSRNHENGRAQENCS